MNGTRNTPVELLYAEQQEREEQALAAIDRIAHELIEETSYISHWGGDVPYDSVIETLTERIAEILGVTTPPANKRLRKRESFTARKSLAVFKRDDYKCVFCGTPDDLTVDHVYPWSKGGSDGMENLQTLCASCNSKKRDKVPNKRLGSVAS